MIKIDDIIKSPKIDFLGKKQVQISNGKILLSVVGGISFVYGDFDETFEIAVIELETGNFMTKYYFPELTDDVFPYMDKKDLESFVNQIFKSGFQVL